MRLKTFLASIVAFFSTLFSTPTTKRVYVVSYVYGDLNELGQITNGGGGFTWNIAKCQTDLDQKEVESFFVNTTNAVTVYRTEHDVPNELFTDPKTITNYLDGCIDDRESPAAAVMHLGSVLDVNCLKARSPAYGG